MQMQNEVGTAIKVKILATRAQEHCHLNENMLKRKFTAGLWLSEKNQFRATLE